MSKLSDIIIQAGGRGTRLETLTANKPKALVPVDNLPMIFHLFKKYPDAHFKIIADYKKDVLRRYLKAFATVDYEVIDADKKGTCSGIGAAVKSVICDKPSLKRKVQREINFKNTKFLGFIESYHYPLKKIVKNICRLPFWEKATYAHLSTFYHAKVHNIKNFWNIDADDTLICASPEKTAEIILAAQNYASENNVDAFSLDMHESENNGNWTWGVTYVQSRLDWWKIFTENKDKKWQDAYLSVESCFNSDNFMNYLKDKNIANNRSFYVNNLYFSHMANIMSWPRCLCLYLWKNSRLSFPILSAIKAPWYDVPIYKENICLNVTLSESESLTGVQKLWGDMDILTVQHNRWFKESSAETPENGRNLGGGNHE